MASENLIGPIPEDWEYTCLREACERGGGNIQTGPFGSQLHASDYVPIGVPSIMPQNIGDNRVVPNGIARITLRDADRLSRYRVRTGDIVYSRRGDVERRALIRDEQDGWLCGTGCLRIRFGNDHVSPLFASYFLGDPRVRQWIVRHAHGATMPNLNTAILSELPFVIPPLKQQEAIGDILGTLDDKIELNRKMNETLEAMARALFKSWFVDFDPVRARAEGRDTDLPARIAALFPDSFEDSELGQIPEGWTVSPLIGQIRLLSGGTPKTDRIEYWNGDILWASAKDVSQSQHSLLIDTERYITGKGLDESATQLIPQFSTVVVARGATTGRMVLLGREMAMNQTCYALVSDRFPFTLNCLLSHTMPQLVHAAHGSVFDTITTSTFTRARVVVPPQRLGNQFEAIVTPIYKRILANVIQSRDLAQLRDAFLPRLMSGELRLPECALAALPAER